MSILSWLYKNPRRRIEKHVFLEKYGINEYKGEIVIKYNNTSYFLLLIFSIVISFFLISDIERKFFETYAFCFIFIGAPLIAIISRKKNALSISLKGVFLREKTNYSWQEISDYYIEHIDELPGDTYKLTIKLNNGKSCSLKLNDLNRNWKEIGCIIEYFRNKATS